MTIICTKDEQAAIMQSCAASFDCNECALCGVCSDPRELMQMLDSTEHKERKKAKRNTSERRREHG